MKLIGMMTIAAVAMGGSYVDAYGTAFAAANVAAAQPHLALRGVRPQQGVQQRPAVVVRAQPTSTTSLTEAEEFNFADTVTAYEQGFAEGFAANNNDTTEESTGGANVFALGGLLTAAVSGAYLASKKLRSPAGSAEEKAPLVSLNSIKTEAVASSKVSTSTLLDMGKWMTETKQPYSKFAALATTGNVKRSNKNYADIQEATKAGAVAGCAPFPEGVDLFGFFNDISEAEAQRYADVEITHGRICMLAALGFLVGEQVEGSSFLFDSQVTGPAINHFQQVPSIFWGLLGAAVFVIESGRVQIAWQNPFEADKLFLLKQDYTPGDYQFDPLNLAKGKDEAWLNDMKLKEVNNGRVAMIAISGMVAQELVNGLNLLPADEVLEMGKSGALELMEKQCAGGPDEAACAKAFEAAERAAVFAGSTL